MKREIHIENIKKIKKFISEKDYEGLKKYIEIREKEILGQEENKSSDYIEKLVNELT